MPKQEASEPPKRGPGAKVMHLLAGGAVGHLAILLSTPIIARLVSPEELAHYAGPLAMSLILGSQATLRWETVMPYAGREEQGGLHRLALCSLFATTLAGFALILLLNYVDVLQLSVTYMAVPVMSLLFGLLAVGQMNALMDGRLHSISLARGTQGVAQAIFQMAAAALGQGSEGLIAAHAMSLWAAVCIVRVGQTAFASSGRWSHARDAFSSHWRRATYSTAAVTTNTVGAQAPILVLLQTDEAAAATFALVIRALQGPILLLGQSYSQYLTAEIASTRRELGPAHEVVLRTMSALLPVCLLIWSVLFLASPMSPTLLGQSWQLAPDTMRALSPFMAFLLISSSLSSVLPALGRHDMELKLQIALALTRILGMATVMPLGSYAVMHAYSISSCALYTLYILTISNLLKIRRRQLRSAARRGAAVLAGIWILYGLMLIQQFR